MNLDAIIVNIEERARLKGLSVTELCRLSGVARSTFTRWKNKKTNPTFSILKKFESILASSPNQKIKNPRSE